MKARLWRWASRIIGVVTIAVIVYAALGLITLTLLSNLDRSWAVIACCVFVGAAVISIRFTARLYFDPTIGSAAALLQKAGKVMWL